MRLIALTACLILMLTSDIMPGQLDSQLIDYTNTKSPYEFIRVWITVHDDLDVSALKSRVTSQVKTRAERHRIAYENLRDRTESQSGLIQQLTQLQQTGRVRTLKSHWIVNVVEAEIAIGELADLAARLDVRIIHEVPEIKTPISIVQSDPVGLPTDAVGVESNLEHINAPATWALGYTGAGRLVCIFDTGIDGAHPALVNNWKGQDGDSAAAWFDQLSGEPFPLPSGQSHGTHVTGIAVGHDDLSGDTIGVAPGARWIGARTNAVGVSVLDAFEWAADPDGNPNTVDDVPDVINHSWYYPGKSCVNTVYDALDATEALGIVNIICAGNDGETASSITNPADRAEDSLDCFAVGNLNDSLDVIWWQSSRGPSPCDLTKTKPNVVAPGTTIRSAFPSSAYNSLTGTSQATPHVSGLVALLRQKNPDATVDEIKTAILNSTQRDGFGTIPNNTYGWGEIDCLAALNALPAVSDTPHVRVYDFTHAPIAPGDTVTGTVVLQNIGANAENVSAVLGSSNDALSVLDASLYFGNIASGDTARSVDSITVIVSDTVTEGSILGIDLDISSTGFANTVRLHFMIEPKLTKMIATHDVGRIEFSLSNFGVYGMGPYSTLQLGGVGFRFNGTSNEWFEAGLIMGDGFTRVSSTVHSMLSEPDLDFKVAPGGNMQFSDPGAAAAQESRSAFNDSLADDPFGLLITQESFALSPPNDDYILLRYILHNPESTTISDLLFGLFLDWDVYNYGQNAGGYESSDGFLWMARNSGTVESPVLSRYRGAKLIDGPLATTAVVEAADYYDNLPTNEKYRILSSGTQYSEINKTNRADLWMLLATGPLTLVPGQTDTVSYAILAGDTFADIQNAASRAQSIPVDVPGDPDTPDGLPSGFALYQNYPNPFNPTTTISFEMPIKDSYELTVYNLLGQVVSRQFGKADRGQVDLEFNGTALASGVYFYKVTVGELTATRKMLLLK